MTIDIDVSNQAFLDLNSRGEHMTHIEAMKQTLEAWASDFLRWRPKPPTASRRTTMTEAERLADELKKGAGLDTQWEAAAELLRLHEHELASNQWLEKTEWVHETVQAAELGMHRADVLKARIDALQNEVTEYRRIHEGIRAAEQEATPGKEVMRISKQGISVNKDFSVDEASQHVLDALSDRILTMVHAAVKEDRKIFAEDCANLVSLYGGSPALEAAIKAKGTL